MMMGPVPDLIEGEGPLTPATENEYYFKVENVLYGSLYYLLKMFRNRWMVETGKNWQQSKEQGEALISQLKMPIPHSTITDRILNGCLEDWDLATLAFVLQNYGDQQEYEELNRSVQQLKDLRNKLSHDSHKNSLRKADYHPMVAECRRILSGLGVDEEEIEKMIKEAGVTDSLAAVKLTRGLYDEAKLLMDREDFEAARDCFDKAVATPSLLRTQLSTAFEKRAEFYLFYAIHQKQSQGEEPGYEKLCNQAVTAADKALELNDNSWNAHFVKGRALRLKSEWKEAIPIFHHTLSMISALESVKNELCACEILVSLESGGAELISPTAATASRNTGEKFSHWDQVFGKKFDESEYQCSMRRYVGQLPLGQDHVLRGHQHRFGWNAAAVEMEAVRYYTKAVMDGNVEGLLCMALCLFDGTGITKDFKKGFDLLKIVAEYPSNQPGRMNVLKKNDAVVKAQYGVGWIYAEGNAEEEAKIDHTKAAEWFKKAAENGSGPAANFLAYLYINGLGAPKDPKMGENFLKQAVKFQDQNGTVALMNYYLRHMEIEKAFEMFKKGKEFVHPGLVEIGEEEFFAATQVRADQRKRSEGDVIAFEKEHKLEVSDLTFLERLKRKRLGGRCNSGRTSENSSEISLFEGSGLDDEEQTSKDVSSDDDSDADSDLDSIESPISQDFTGELDLNENNGVMERKPKLKAEGRKELIIQHRELIHKMTSLRKNHKVNLEQLGVTQRPPMLNQNPPQKMSGVSSIALKDMSKSLNRIYEDRVIDLIIIDEPNLKLPVIHLIVEDLNGDVTRVLLSKEKLKERVIPKLKCGRKIAILNPYKQIGGEASFENGIRVDDPNCLICLGMLEKLCRFCGEKDGEKRCPVKNCKKAYYCDQECQQRDVKFLEHKKICQATT